MTVTALDARTDISGDLQKVFAGDSLVTESEATRIEALGRQRGWRLRHGKLTWSSGMTMDGLLSQYYLAEAA